MIFLSKSNFNFQLIVNLDVFYGKIFSHKKGTKNAL